MGIGVLSFVSGFRFVCLIWTWFCALLKQANCPISEDQRQADAVHFGAGMLPYLVWGVGGVVVGPREKFASDGCRRGD